MALSEKTLYSVGRRWVYIFNRRKAKKEIPANRLFSAGGYLPSVGNAAFSPHLILRYIGPHGEFRVSQEINRHIAPVAATGFCV